MKRYANDTNMNLNLSNIKWYYADWIAVIGQVIWTNKNSHENK